MKLQNNLYTILSKTEGQKAKAEDPNYELCVIHYELSLIEDCMIYKAHFPNNPITPGACIIQIAQELYEQSCGHAVEITEVKNAKFLQPIRCSGEQTHINYQLSIANCKFPKLQVVVSDDDAIYAKFSLVCKTV